MINKHIFCDLDGTLLKESTYIDEEDINALKEAERNGYSISIATGRLDYEVKSILDNYGFNGFRVSQNGGVVFDHNDQLVHQVELEMLDVKKILNELTSFNVITFYQTPNSYIVEERLPLVIEFEKTQKYIKYHENRNIKNELDQQNIVTISIWAYKDENIKIKKYLDTVLPSHIVSYISSSYTLDITHVVNSKGNAINKLCMLNNISLEDIVVIGDSHNDISMFELTKNSYVMNEANDEVKSYASFVVSSVKEAINHVSKK
ncbi:MAG: Cof-like hydrolase [Haloplasmataceae bacterium]|jgi:Cof subfamily protein (haloacid dehalogenase superfamily)|nr:Cof-like hydrolase [Haloplasmataceae bacterium]